MSKKQRYGDRLDHYPLHLRGPAQNGHGGHQTQRIRGLRGNTYGAANAGRVYSAEERQTWAAANGYSAK